MSQFGVEKDKAIRELGRMLLSAVAVEAKSLGIDLGDEGMPRIEPEQEFAAAQRMFMERRTRLLMEAEHPSAPVNVSERLAAFDRAQTVPKGPFSAPAWSRADTAAALDGHGKAVLEREGQWNLLVDTAIKLGVVAASGGTITPMMVIEELGPLAAPLFGFDTAQVNGLLAVVRAVQARREAERAEEEAEENGKPPEGEPVPGGGGGAVPPPNPPGGDPTMPVPPPHGS